ncbi:MAG: Hpt domain-containing protein [Pseudohaliea sp.]
MPRHHAPAADRRQLERLLADLGSGTLDAVLRQCSIESGERLRVLRAALARGDADAAAREAHTLGGLQRSIGLPSLGDAFAALERRLAAGEQPEAASLEELASALAGAHEAARRLAAAGERGLPERKRSHGGDSESRQQP